MKFSSIHFCGAAVAVNLLINIALAAPEDGPKFEVVPLIVMDDVPLTAAIRNLARQAGINFILDPHVPGSGFAAGKGVPEPLIYIRRENVTAQEALNDLLKEHKLELITNPATTIARIAPTNLAVKPIPANPALTGTNEVYPLVVLDDVPLEHAIRNVARRSFVNVTIDPRLTEPSFDLGGPVSVRWEKLTARQALAALLDTYGLVMKEDAATSFALIKFKPLGRTDPAQKGDADKKQP